jgi:hypothetical protein
MKYLKILVILLFVPIIMIIDRAILVSSEEYNIRVFHSMLIDGLVSDRRVVICFLPPILKASDLGDILEEKFNVDYRSIPKTDVYLEQSQFLIFYLNKPSDAVWLEKKYTDVDTESHCEFVSKKISIKR